MAWQGLNADSGATGRAEADREQPAEVTGRRLPEEDRGGGRSPSFPVLERIALALHATLDVSLPRKGGRHGRQGRHLEGGVLARRGSQGPSKAETGGHGQGRQESGGARSNQDRCQAGGRRYVHLRSPQGRWPGANLRHHRGGVAPKVSVAPRFASEHDGQLWLVHRDASSSVLRRPADHRDHAGSDRGLHRGEAGARRVSAPPGEGAIGCFATDWAPGPSVDPPACGQGEGDSGQPDEGGRIPPGPADRPGRPLFGAGGTGAPGRGQNGSGSRRCHDAPTVGSDRDACR